MQVEYLDGKYVPAGPATLKQGVKGNTVPDGAVAGGNGSYIMMGEPNQAIITVRDVSNNQAYRVDIRSQIKYDVFGGGKVTEKRVKKVFKALAKASPFEMSASGKIKKIDKICAKI